MAMNIPAPVQILRYEIPEGSTVNDVYEYVYNNIKEGMMLLIVGDVLRNNISIKANEKFATSMFAIGVKYDDVVSPVFIPIITYGSGIADNYIYTDVGRNLFTNSVNDVIPSNAFDNYNNSSMSSRGLIVGPTNKTNIDTVYEYGIYWPDADSTLPEEIKSRNNLVLHYSSSGRSTTNIQILLSSRDFGTSNPVLIYTRQSGSIHPSGPEDWSPWQSLGGSSLTAGDGISITDDAVAVDDTVVRTEGEQAINGSLRVWHYASAAVTVSKKDTDGNVNAKLSPNNLYFRFGDNARDFVSITSGGTASSMGNSTYARLTAHNDATMSSATLSVHATDEGTYTTAPSTRSIPTYNEIITYDYFRDHAVTLRTGNIYVDNVNGSDSNDGLTADTALATFEAAITLRQKVKFYDPSTNDTLVTINLAASGTSYTYSKSFIPNETNIVGEGSDTTFINFSKDINIRSKYISFDGLTLGFTGATDDADGLLAFYNCNIIIRNCIIRSRIYNITTKSVLYNGDSGYVFMNNVTFDLGSVSERVIFINYTSSCAFNNITISGAATVSVATIAVDSLSTIDITNLTSSNATIIGRRYSISNGSGINTVGAGPNAIPGSEAGTVDDTSWYK